MKIIFIRKNASSNKQLLLSMKKSISLLINNINKLKFKITKITDEKD